jgi:integrase
MSDDTTVDTKARMPRSRMEDRPAITDDFIRGLDRTGKPAIVYDGAGGTRGFGIRRTDLTFVLNYYTRTGTERRFPIGQFPAWKVERARKRAHELRVEIDKGGDPMGEQHADRQAPVVRDLIAKFIEDHVSTKRESTRIGYLHILRRYIEPAIGALKVDAVEHHHADELHRRVTRHGHAYQANRVQAIGHRLFKFAVRLRWRRDGVNPFAGVERNPEEPRERYLSGEELTRLLQVMAHDPDLRSIRVIKLLLLTGSRKSEVCAMQWDHVDLAAKRWSKPAVTMKAGKRHTLPLNSFALQLLDQIRSEQVANSRTLPTHVFEGSGRRQHITQIGKTWRRLCRDADLKGVRLHDLRHTHATYLAAVAGSSLLAIGQLLGHRTPAATHRYAHAVLDPLAEASEKVGAFMYAAADADQPDPCPPAEVVSLPKRHGR